jgi:DNA (cytosine-5)-methyltransferase 1
MGRRSSRVTAYAVDPLGVNGERQRRRLLDLFCGAGGGACGYERAGWEVIGVDITAQPLYPFEFYQQDALIFLADVAGWGPYRFDAIHASPPCQFATRYKNNRAHVRRDHPNLIPMTREFLQATELPYVIENVEDAREHLVEPVQICGTGLGVPIRRHRLFETNWPLIGVPCAHGAFTERRFPGSSNRPKGRTVMNVGEYRVPLTTQREVMEMPWANLHGISQAIPPRYTEHVGTQLLAHLGRFPAGCGVSGERQRDRMTPFDGSGIGEHHRESTKAQCPDPAREVRHPSA